MKKVKLLLAFALMLSMLTGVLTSCGLGLFLPDMDVSDILEDILNNGADEPSVNENRESQKGDTNEDWEKEERPGLDDEREERPGEDEDSEGNTTGGGDNVKYIYFGEYPQTIKAEGVTVGTTTDSRGYYLGSDDCYYAKVTAKPNTAGGYYNVYFSTHETVSGGMEYYFKVEPIRWRVLSENNETALVLCDSIIANTAYDSGRDSNYADSEVRAWLNATFYDTAFTALERELVITTTVDNSAESAIGAENPFVCENTEDKIFLLSYADVINDSYGFSPVFDSSDEARQMLTSDYARATGAFMTESGDYAENGYWWLRSPYFEGGDKACCILDSGAVNTYSYGGSVWLEMIGVVPAMQIRLDEDGGDNIPDDNEGEAEKGYEKEGDYIYFGEYPQIIKEANVAIDETSVDSRGYFLGSDNCYYAKVTATPYRSGYKFSDDTTVSGAKAYYFKVEPIRWRILSENGSTATIFCDSIIANMAYDADGVSYAESDVRAWLISTFYETAFAGYKKDIINTTSVDNSGESAGAYNDMNACEDTEDKVFLLSFVEATDENLGFLSDYFDDNGARQLLTSDYARATGAYISTSSDNYGVGYWWLRSPYNAGSVRAVYKDGSIDRESYSVGSFGVVPAMQIKL